MGRKPGNGTAGAPAGGPLTLEEVVAAIVAEQQKIEAEEKGMRPREARVIGSQIEIGRRLAASKTFVKRAGKPWTKFVEAELGYAPRVARRLVRVGASKWAASGPSGSVLEELPGDLHKLDALSPLDLSQLQGLLAAANLKQMDRTDIAAHVREILGKKRSPSTASPGTRLLKLIGRFAAKALAEIEDGKGAGFEPEARQECLDTLDSSCRQIREAFAEHEPQAEVPEGVA
jgi:hypothetical protein